MSSASIELCRRVQTCVMVQCSQVSFSFGESFAKFTGDVMGQDLCITLWVHVEFIMVMHVFTV